MGSSGVVTQEALRSPPNRVMEVISEATAVLRLELGDDGYERGRFPEAVELFARVALADEFPEFLTSPPTT